MQNKVKKGKKSTVIHVLTLYKYINKIDKFLARLTKKKRESTKISKIINERGEITTSTAEI